MPTTKDVKRPGQSRVVCTVTFQEEEYAPAESKALERLAAELNLKGFRPGKAPAEMVRGKVDPERLFEETVRLLLANALPSLFETEKIKPIMPPKVEAISKLPLTLQITFVEYPEVKVKGGDKLKSEKKEMKVDPKDMQRVLDSVLGEHRTFKPVERAAQKDDQVTIDFHGTDGDGKAVEGLKAEGYSVILGQAQLLPGFEEQLIGLKGGEEKSFTLTMPDKFPAEQLRGKPVTFHVKALRVEETKLPELTDDFAKEKLRVNSAAEFKQKVEDSIHGQEEQFDRMRREREILEAITKATQVDLPDELLDEETRGLFQDFAQRLEDQGSNLKEWMEREKKDPKQVEEDMRKQAKERATLRFGISQLIKDRNIEPNEHDMEHATADFLSQIPEEEHEEVRKSIVPGTDAHRELHWRACVSHLMHQLLD